MFRGVSVSGGALGLSLDVCSANKGEKLVIEQKLVVHRSLRVHTCGESCTCEGEMHFRGEFLLCLARGFLATSGMTVSSPASVFEESCLCLIDCVKPLPLS